MSLPNELGSYDLDDWQIDEWEMDRTNPGKERPSRSYLSHVGTDLGMGALIQVHNKNMENSED